MDWNKAKKIILISFITLNLGLLIVIFITKTNYYLTSSQESNIIQVLSRKYNISVYQELPKKYEPIQELELVNEVENLSDVLLDKFLADEDQINNLVEGTRKTYQGETRTLVVQNGSFTITSSDGIESTPENIIKLLGENFDNFYLFAQTKSPTEETRYEFREKFEGQTIYTNYVEILENDGKIYMIDGYYAKPLNFTGEKNEIISVDRALFTLAQSIPKSEGRVTIIDDISIVYNQGEITSEPRAVLKARPCYLISVEGGVTPYKVDAYTNELIN